MKIGGIPHRTIWVEPDGWSVGIIDQTRLPHEFETLTLRDVEDAARAIRDMQVRGAPLIGATGRLWHGAGGPRRCERRRRWSAAHRLLAATRPTAVNLRWALDRMRDALAQPPAGRARARWPIARRPRSPRRMWRSTGPSARPGCR